VEGVDIGNQADELLYQLSVEFPKDIEMIESYYDDDGSAYARVAFQGRVFKVTIEPEEGP